MHAIARRRLPSSTLPLLLAALCLLPLACNKKSEPAPAPSGTGGDSARATLEPGQAAPGSGGNGPASNLGANAGPPCGARTCAAGQVCCNASCGICTPPDGVCTQQLCDGAPADSGSIPPGPACSQDGDCRLFSDYCTGCDCRALLKTDKDPLCSGPGVRCLADPCQNHTAVCRDGKCQAATPKTPRGR
jgi:hypothetical protein